jgi:hypothetical protein
MTEPCHPPTGIEFEFVFAAADDFFIRLPFLVVYVKPMIGL